MDIQPNCISNIKDQTLENMAIFFDMNRSITNGESKASAARLFIEKYDVDEDPRNVVSRYERMLKDFYGKKRRA